MAHNIAVRLVVDGGKAKAEIVEFGKTGKKSMQEIVKSGKPASKTLKALGAAANDVKGAATGLANQIGPLGAGLASIGPAGLAAAAAFAALTLGLKSALAVTMEEEQAQNRLQGVLNATRYASGLTKSEIVDMAEGMENSTMASSEAVEQAAGIMATFRSVSGDTFKKSIHLAQDMAAVFGQDLRSSVTQLGKALEDPISGITALKRVGVSFSDSQKEVIARLVETGKKAEAQRLILAALEEQVGGASKSETQGLTGASHRLSVSWDDMLKAIGGTETVGGTAEDVLNKLASTFRTTTEWISDGTLDQQINRTSKELQKMKKELEWFQDLSSPMQFFWEAGSDYREKQVEVLQKKLDELTKEKEREKKEKEKALAGQKAAEAEGINDLIASKTKGFDAIINKSLESDPAYQISKINDQLEQTIHFFENLRTASNTSKIDEAIEKAKEASSIQVGNIQNSIAEAAQKESDANQKIVDDLKKKLIGMADERKAFIEQAVSHLSNNATDAQKQQTTDLAGQLFDEQAFEKAQKIVDDLNDKMKELGMTARQLFVKEAVDALPDSASADRVAQVEELSGALYDEQLAREKLNDLRDEGRGLMDEAKTAAEKYAQKIEHLNELLNSGSISQDVYNKALEGANTDLLASRTDPQSSLFRAYKEYEEGATDTATAIQSAFSTAMSGTEDAIVDMVTSAEINLSSLNDVASSIVSDITRMFVQQNITSKLYSYLSESSTSGGWVSSLMSAFTLHEGGTAGSGGVRRSVPAFVFAGAPRYHSGGIAGLKPDEVPAILQRGEEVVSKKNRNRRSSSVNMVMNISTPNANSFRASQGQIISKAAKSINRAKRNM